MKTAVGHYSGLTTKNLYPIENVNFPGRSGRVTGARLVNSAMRTSLASDVQLCRKNGGHETLSKKKLHFNVQYDIF